VPNLSKRTVESARPREREYILWDEALPGFGLRVFPSGKRSYCIQYRSDGRTRRMALGLHGLLTATPGPPSCPGTPLRRETRR
jgi:hypothetical protein